MSYKKSYKTLQPLDGFIRAGEYRALGYREGPSSENRV